MDENSQQIMLELSQSIQALNQSINENTAVRKVVLTQEQQERLKNSESISTNTESIGKNTKTVEDNSRAKEAEIAAAKKYQAAMEGFANALKSGTEGVKSIFEELIKQDPSRSFVKYGKGLESLADAVSSATAGMGGFAKFLGPVAQGMATVFKLQAEQAANLHKANDQLAQFGTAGNFTVEELRKMANQAGVTSKNMDVLVNPIKSLGSGLINLGGTTGQGVKAFAELAKITNQQREEYQRLGVSQEQLVQNQADYVQLQRMSGRVISTEVKDRAALQKASLEYTDNLLKLSAISGQDVESLKKRQQEASTVAELQIKNMQMEQRATDLRAKGDEASVKEADRIQKEMVVRQKLLDMAVQTGDQQTIAATQSYLATGTITEQSKQFALMGIDMDKFNREMKEGKDVSGDFANALVEGGKRMVRDFGGSAVFSEEIRKTTGLNKEFLTFLNRGVKDYNKNIKDAEAAQQGAKKPGKDPGQDSRAALTTAEIEAGKAIDKLTSWTNVLTGGFTAQTVFMTAFGVSVVAATKYLLGMAGTKLVDAGKNAVADVMKKVPGLGGFAAGASGGAMPPAPMPPTSAPPVPARAPGGGSDIGKTMASAGKGLGDLGAGAGKFIAGVGQGGGKAIAALFKGVATGLKAFANPMVVAGAAGFGAAIAAVGAGLAAASWLMGKALPTLAEGFNSFEKLDGKKLGETGDGISSLAKGLAIFGATSALSNLGNIAGSLVEGVGKLFGAKSPIQKFEEFSKLKIDHDRLKKNVEAYQLYTSIVLGKGSTTPAVPATPIVGGGTGERATNDPRRLDRAESVPAQSKTEASISKLEELERKRAALEKQGPRTRNQQSIESHEEMLKTLDMAIASEKAKQSAPKAAIGGIFDGPKSGYPVELHGKEAVVPLTGQKVDNLDEEARNKIDWEEESEDVDKFSKALTDTELNLKKFTTTVIKLNEFNQKELEVKEELEDANTDLKGAVKGAFINLSSFADRLKVTTASSPTSQTGTAVQTGSGGTLMSGTGAPVTTGAPPVSARPAGAETKPVTTPPKPGSMGEKVDTKAMQSAMMKELGSMGISDPKAQANILAQVQAESGFKPRSEEIEKYSAKTLFKLYGPGSGNKVRFRSLEEAQSIVDKGPEAVGNIIYGGRMGNAADEGYKYRGRGLIQLTGKSNYEKYSKLLGIDLVKDPDLANDPAVAAKIAAVYFKEKEKRGVDLTDIGAVGKAVGYAGGQAETQKRAQYAKSFESQIQQAEKGGVFEGPESGYVVELHGKETVIPNEKITSVSKKPIKLFSEEMGPTFAGSNEFTGYNMGPLTTDLKTIKKMAGKIGAFEESTGTITDPDMWKSILHSGIATNYQLGPTTLGTESFGPDVGDILGDRLKEIMEGGNLNVADAMQKLSSEFKDALQTLSNDLTANIIKDFAPDGGEEAATMKEVLNSLNVIADKLGEGNNISDKILQYSKV